MLTCTGVDCNHKGYATRVKNSYDEKLTERATSHGCPVVRAEALVNRSLPERVRDEFILKVVEDYLAGDEPEMEWSRDVPRPERVRVYEFPSERRTPLWEAWHGAVNNVAIACLAREFASEEAILAISDHIPNPDGGAVSVKGLEKKEYSREFYTRWLEGRYGRGALYNPHMPLDLRIRELANPARRYAAIHGFPMNSSKDKTLEVDPVTAFFFKVALVDATDDELEQIEEMFKPEIEHQMRRAKKEAGWVQESAFVVPRPVKNTFDEQMAAFWELLPDYSFISPNLFVCRDCVQLHTRYENKCPHEPLTVDNAYSPPETCHACGHEL